LKFALEKFFQQRTLISKQMLDNISLAYQSTNKASKQRFMVKVGQSIDTINTEDVHHFQTQDSITFLVNNQGKRFPIDYTLDEVDELLPRTIFFRINRKAIINIKAIEKVNTHINSRLHITANNLAGDYAVVSRERVAEFKLWLDS
jgi:DNA-binding LytR/AlgR family response regulator